VLQRENIESLHRFRVVTWIGRFDGIGPTTARAIREELARAVRNRLD
jgi:hypothetical protein